MFRKNKIQSGIDNTIAYNSDDFDSLDIVRNKLKKKKLVNRLIVNPVKSMKLDISAKYIKTSKYLISHSYFILKWFLYTLIAATFIILNILLFKPFYGANVGSEWTIINNTWMAILTNNNITYIMTPLGFVFVGIAVLTIGIYVVYLFYRKKLKVWNDNKSNLKISKTDRVSKIILCAAYVLIISSVLLILITILIPPSSSSLYSEQSITDAWTYIQKYRTDQIPKDETKLISYVTTIYDYYGYTMPTFTSVDALLLQVSKHYQQGLFASSIYYENYWFFSNVFRESISTLSIDGIIITVVYSVILSIGAIILPSVITYRDVKLYYSENAKYNKSWNIWKLFMYSLMRIFGRNYIKTFKDRKIKFQKARAVKKELRKNKETYSKFKKQNREQGISNNEESFGSNQLNNAAFSVITKEEIESHEANKAFLNTDGDWMYHDGEGNYFVAKNDEWVIYDLNKAIHKVHTDANAKLNLDPSKKQYKEGRFKKAKNKKSTPIALPDDGLDDILKKLDI